MSRRRSLLCSVSLLLAAAALAAPPVSAAAPAPDATKTATPIKHLVVLYNENVSFDHYFATYPNAANPPGEPAFAAAPGTPRVNNLVNADLLTRNPEYQPRQWRRRVRAVPAGSDAGEHRRPEPRLHGRAAGLQWRQGGPVSEIHRQGHGLWRGRLRHHRPGDGLFRRQHRRRDVALRTAFRDERQCLYRHLWPVDARGAGSGVGPDQRHEDRRHHHEAVHSRRCLLLHRRRPGRHLDDKRRRSRLRCMLEALRPGNDAGPQHRRPAGCRRH